MSSQSDALSSLDSGLDDDAHLNGEGALSPQAENEIKDEEDEGLFGSEDEADGSTTTHHLDDPDLDSEDEDDDHRKRVAEAQGEVHMTEIDLFRQPVPSPGDDGELYLLKLPTFLSIEPKAFDPQSFAPPTAGHHETIPSAHFSAYSTATSTLRWRHSLNDPSKIESNARILRWSDGSLTLQLAGNATEQYQLPSKTLAPTPSVAPKPSPSNIKKGNIYKAEPDFVYNPQQDAHVYLTTGHESASVIQLHNHLTTSLTVLPGSDANDEALVRLQQSLAAAVRGNKNADGGIEIITIKEDPELQKRRAEIAEREKVRAQRRREAAENRDRDRANRVLGKSNLRVGGGASNILSLDRLEGESLQLGSRKRGAAAGKRSTKRSRPRGDDYDTDDEPGRRGRTREDEYDREDGFLVDSDEEELEENNKDDGDEEDTTDDEVEDKAQQAKVDIKTDSKTNTKTEAKGISPKRQKLHGNGVRSARSKRQKVVIEDDDDED